MDWTAPTTDEMHDVAAEAVRQFPPPFGELAKDVVIRVADFASDAILSEMDSDPFELTGLYDGIPVTLKSNMDQPSGPDVVWLFRQPILAEWAERGDVTLKALVAHVTVHEFAHHFGWSDDDIAAIDRWWE